MDPYATLNVPRDASREQIRQSFAKIARSTHPDKQGAGGAQDSASMGEAFGSIDEAYKVLSDDQMRSAYDEFGEQGVLILKEMRTAKEREILDEKRRISRRAFRHRVKLFEEGLEEGLNSSQTLVRCHVRIPKLKWRKIEEETDDEIDEVLLLDQLEDDDDAALIDALEPAVDDEQLEEPKPKSFSAPFITQLFVQHSLVLQPHNNDQLTLSFVAGAAKSRTDKRTNVYEYSPTLGTVSLVYAKAIGQTGNEFSFGLNLQALKGQPNLFQSSFSRRIDSKTAAVCELKMDDSGSNDLQFSLKRGIASDVAGEATLNFSQGRFDVGFLQLALKGTSPVAFSKQQRAWSVSVLVPAASPDVALMGEVAQPWTKRSLVRIQGGMSLGRGPNLALESARTLDERSAISGKVTLSLLQGVSFRFRYTRGTNKYDVPVSVSRNFKLSTAFGACFIPWSIQYLLRKVLRPWRERLAAARRGELINEAVEAKKRARNQMKLMRAGSEATRQDQLAKDGLVILEAVFGSRLSEADSLTDWENDGDLRPNLDVTVQLQFFVNKQFASINLLGPLENALGFYDPSVCFVDRAGRVWEQEPGEEDEDESPSKNQLFVRYLFRGEKYEKVFEPGEKIELPNPTAVRIVNH